MNIFHFPFVISRLPFANSISTCNELMFEKYFVWRFEAKGFARAVV